MFDSKILDEVAELAGIEVSGASTAAVESGIAQVARVRSWLDGIEAGLVSRAEALARDGEGAGGTGTLTSSGNSTSRRARKVRKRSKTVENAPEMGEKLTSGDISGEHVDALGRAADSLPADKRPELFDQSADLADRAAKMPVDAYNRFLDRLTRELRDDEGEKKLDKQKRSARLRTWTDKTSGMLRINGDLDPECGARLLAGLDQEVAALAALGAPKNDHTRAQALVNLVSRGRTSAPGAPTNELLLIVDADTYTDGLHPYSTCETSTGTPLPPESMRRLTCSPHIATVVRDANGVSMEAGRTKRTANRAQRRALRAMYPTCAFASCDRSFDWCEIHHIQPWEQGGPTELWNLLPLCCEHHHLVHEGHWRLELAHDRTLTIHQPDGTLHAVVDLPSAPAAKAAVGSVRHCHELALRRLRQHIQAGAPPN